MRVVIGTALCLAVITGCATSSGPVPFGKDTYMISISENVSGAKGVSRAAKEANTHCASMGKEFIFRTTTQSGGGPGFGTLHTNLVYSCVFKDDPEYTRPNMGNLPNTNININR
jgi:hypothetical protein